MQNVIKLQMIYFVMFFACNGICCYAFNLTVKKTLECEYYIYENAMIIIDNTNYNMFFTTMSPKMRLLCTKKLVLFYFFFFNDPDISLKVVCFLNGGYSEIYNIHIYSNNLCFFFLHLRDFYQV